MDRNLYSRMPFLDVILCPRNLILRYKKNDFIIFTCKSNDEKPTRFLGVPFFFKLRCPTPRSVSPPPEFPEFREDISLEDRLESSASTFEGFGLGSTLFFIVSN